MASLIMGTDVMYAVAASKQWAVVLLKLWKDNQQGKPSPASMTRRQMRARAAAAKQYTHKTTKLSKGSRADDSAAAQRAGRELPSRVKDNVQATGADLPRTRIPLELL